MKIGKKLQQWLMTGTLLVVCSIVVYAASTAQWLADGFFVSNAALTATAGAMVRGDGTQFQTTTLPTTVDANADNAIGTSATTKKALVLQGKASQTANVFEVQGSNGTTVFSVQAPTSVITGARNNMAGNSAGAAITSGADNTFLGDQAGKVLTVGAKNTFIGSSAGVADTQSNGTEGENTFIGYNAALVLNNSTNGRNTFIGSQAGVAATTSQKSVLIGRLAGGAITTGNNNTIVGAEAVFGTLTTGASNTIVGQNCSVQNAADSNAVALGFQAVTAQGCTVIGSNAGVNALSTTNAIVIGTNGGNVKGASTSIIESVAAINSATTNDFYIAAGDSGFNRVATGVMQVNTGNGGRGAAWLQQSAGSVRLSADYTNATAAFTNTALSLTLTGGRAYSFHCVLIYSDSTAADGAQFDFNGGSATVTNFVAGSEGGINDTVTTTLAGAYSQSTVTGNNITTIDGTFEPLASGTFIVRGAQVAHSTGTLTLKQGSYLVARDMP